MKWRNALEHWCSSAKILRPSDQSACFRVRVTAETESHADVSN